MKRIILAIAAACLLVAPAHAQSPDQRLSHQLDAKTYRRAVDITTTVLVGYTLLDAYDRQLKKAGNPCSGLIENGSCRPGWKKPLLKDALGVGLTVAIAEITKHLVQRVRPDGSDANSFFSEHTAIASLPVGWLPGIKAPIFLSISVGVGRVAAQKHYPSDALAGAAVGQLFGRLTR